MTKKQFTPKQPITSSSADIFESTQTASAIVDDIILRMQTPNRFGIYGRSGSGKSSIIALLQEKLDGKAKKYAKYVTAHFSPSDFSSVSSEDMLLEMLDTVRKAAKVTATKWKTLNTLEKWTAKGDKELSAALKKNTLVLFIDDLHRCPPNHAIAVLEAVASFFTTSSVLCVVGADEQMLIDALSGLDRYTRESATLALRRFIPYAYSTPRVHLEPVVNSILEEYGIETEDGERYYLADFFRHFAPEPAQAEYFLHQFCITLKLGSDELREYASFKPAGSITSPFIETFLVVFLLKRFPTLFGDGNNEKRLRAILNCIECSNDPVRYQAAVARIDFLHDSDRMLAEDILQFSFFRGDPAKRGMVNILSLLRAHKLL